MLHLKCIWIFEAGKERKWKLSKCEYGRKWKLEVDKKKLKIKKSIEALKKLSYENGMKNEEELVRTRAY